MADYNFWMDLLDTFQSSPNWIKAVWLLIPPGFLLALIAMLMRYRIASKRAGKALDGELIYSIHRRTDGDLQIVRHLPEVDRDPALLLLDDPSRDAKPRSPPITLLSGPSEAVRRARRVCAGVIARRAWAASEGRVRAAVQSGQSAQSWRQRV